MPVPMAYDVTTDIRNYLKGLQHVGLHTLHFQNHKQLCISMECEEGFRPL